MDTHISHGRRQTAAILPFAIATLFEKCNICEAAFQHAQGIIKGPGDCHPSPDFETRDYLYCVKCAGSHDLLTAAEIVFAKYNWYCKAAEKVSDQNSGIASDNDVDLTILTESLPPFFGPTSAATPTKKACSNSTGDLSAPFLIGIIEGAVAAFLATACLVFVCWKCSSGRREKKLREREKTQKDLELQGKPELCGTPVANISAEDDGNSAQRTEASYGDSLREIEWDLSPEEAATINPEACAVDLKDRHREISGSSGRQEISEDSGYRELDVPLNPNEKGHEYRSARRTIER